MRKRLPVWPMHSSKMQYRSHQLITKFCRLQTLLAAAANILCLVFLVFQDTITTIIIIIVLQDTITTIIITIVLQDGCAGITVDDLKDQLTRHEGLLENLTISIGKWLVPPRPTAARKSWCQMLRFGQITFDGLE